MTIISLHQIVCNILMKRKYPVHYYIDFLVYCKDGLREIAFDDGILATRYKCLIPDDANEVQIPNDYQDYTRVSVRIDQYIRPLVEDNNLQTVPNYNSDFEIQPYSEGVAQPDASSNGQSLGVYGYSLPYWWANSWNTWGENTGRLYGGVGVYADTFKVIKSRGVIKINETLCVDEVLVEYISNGMDADSATHIDSYAQMAIESFAMWQFKEHNRTYGAGEAEAERQRYLAERSILRARLSDITMDKLKRVVQSNYRRIKY